MVFKIGLFDDDEGNENDNGNDDNNSEPGIKYIALSTIPMHFEDVNDDD